MEELIEIIFTVLGLGIIAIIVLSIEKSRHEWFYPDGKKGMVKIKPDGSIGANTDSPRWWNAFFWNIEMMQAISCETATKIANHQPLTQEEIDKIEKQKEYVNRKYGTKEQILSGHGSFEDPNFRGDKKVK